MTKKNVLQEFSKADYVTLLSVFLIVIAFWLLWNKHIYIAISLAFVSMFFDYLDGRIARKFGSSPYGKVLDSLYDILGWVLFVALVVNIESAWAWYSILITTIFCIFATMRLSRFTVSGYVKKHNLNYVGLPVSYSRYALLLVLVLDAKISVLILAIMIPLMVSSRLFKKSPQILMQVNLLYSAIFLYLNFKHV